MRRLALFVLVALLGSALCASAAGNLRVSPSDPDRGPGSGALGATRVVTPGGVQSSTDVKNLRTGLTFGTIQEAIDDVGTLAGDVLDVQAASHAEGICVVSKAVTIQGGGGGGAIVTSTTDTGTSGDARAWFLVTVAGVTFKDLTLDGSANVIWQALRFKEAGAVDHCTLQHIKSVPAHYNGVGIVGYKSVAVTGCTFSDCGRIGVILFGADVTAGVVSGCSYTGKGGGDWLDYGIELGGGAVAALTNNNITACTGVASVDGSGSAGVLVTTYYGAGTTATVTGNVIAGNSVGLFVGYDGADVSTVVAHSNDLSSNPDATLANISSTVTVDASANGWGTNTPAGVLGTIYGIVDYTPWFHNAGDVSGSPGFQGDYSALDVAAASPQSGSANRIQEAIDLVSGSTVLLAPGNYPGNVVVNQKIVLQGAGDGTNPLVDTILLPPAGTTGILIQAGGSGPTDRCVIRDLRISGGQFGLYTLSTLGFLTLQNLTATGASVRGFEINNAADLTDVVMTDVDLIGNVTDGMRVRGKLNGLVMTNGHLDGNTYGIQSYTAALEGNNFRNVVVTGTTFNNNTSKGMYFEKLSDALFDGITVSNSGTVGGFAAGIDFNLKYAAYQNIEIRNSAILGCGVGDATNGVGVAVKARSDAPSYSTYPATLTNVDLVGNTLTGCQNAIRLGEPGKNNAGPTGVDVHQNQITGSLGMGLANASLATPSATCNWWGNVLGPNVPPGNPSPGDGITGLASYVPWWSTVTGPCDAYGPNHVAPQPAATCITPAHPCVNVPVVFTRGDVTAARGVSVTFTIDPTKLALCSTPAASIHQGSWLAGFASTHFEVLDNGSGSYTVDQTILGLPCGVTTGGQLFTVDLKAADGDGTGAVTVTDVAVRDCNNAPLPGIPGAAVLITVDNTLPGAIANLAATQVKSGNDTDGTTKIHLTFTAPSDAVKVHVYRAGWGNYPEYDDVGGGVPATPAYLPGAPWTLAATLTAPVTAYDDEVLWPQRDFWYYVAFVEDACGNVSAASNQTAGTLNYHLGDISGPGGPGTGNNQVVTVDVSLLGTHYGTTLIPADPFNYLDVGPTTDYSVNARPTTDNKVNFEDLMMFAINYGQVTGPQDGLAPVAAGGADRLWLDGPAKVTAGQTFTVAVGAAGAGDLQGLSLQLGWDRSVAEPVGVEAGGLAEAQNVAVLSSGAGNVDCALLGANRGLAGEGVLATVTFRALANGDPRVTLAKVDARDASNQPVALAGVKPQAPGATSFAPAMPNPFQRSTTLSYALAKGGAVELAVYGVDGRKVATLASGVQAAGTYRLTWDGAGARPGLYYARLTTPEGRFTRTLVLMK